MTVWVVTVGEHFKGGHVVGVFAVKADAEACARYERRQGNCDWCDVDEWAVAETWWSARRYAQAEEATR